MRLATSTNPLTKEEWKRPGELLDKDDQTLEEALELRELARKVVREYGEYPEAWKLHIYASIMAGKELRKTSGETRPRPTREQPYRHPRHRQANSMPSASKSSWVENTAEITLKIVRPSFMFLHV